MFNDVYATFFFVRQVISKKINPPKEKGMFNQETCKRCGLCLHLCPFIEMPKEETKAEIERMIELKESLIILKNCAGCAFCDVICPTQSNPSHLRKDITTRKNSDKGRACLSLITDQVPFNMMTIGLEFEPEEQLKDMDAYLNPDPNEEVFYLGCALSHIYTDLAKTKLMRRFPKIGGMKYCCGVYAHAFGEEEARIKGKQLLKEFEKLGTKRLITFCTGCDDIIGHVYPKIIPEFDIETVNIATYLLQEHQKREIAFTHPINKRVTFHDPCAWRMLKPEIRENPRKLLQLMGADVVEMKHNREKSLCCGTPLIISGKNLSLGSKIAEKRVSEAKEIDAEVIAVSCTGCFSALVEKAEEQNIEVYYITELAQMAIGEKPLHRLKEMKNQLTKNIIKKITENPEIWKQKFIIKNGEIKLI
jgi:Fe-S oxidoreductase